MAGHSVEIRCAKGPSELVRLKERLVGKVIAIFKPMITETAAGESYLAGLSL